MAIHPVGPLPASTYWLRRGALLLGFLVLLLVARSCVGGEDDPRSTVAPDETSSPTPAASTAAPSTTAPRPPAAPQPCADTALEVTPDSDEAVYALGDSPRFSVTVKNTSTVACTRDLGSGAVELVIFSGEDRVWSSDDCSTSKAKDVETLAPGAQKVVSITWAGKRSKPRCAGERAEAKAGTYRLTARIGTLTEGAAVFRFRS